MLLIAIAHMFFLSGSSRDIFAFNEKKARYLLFTFKAGKGAQGKRKKGEAYKMIFTLESQNYKFSNTLTFLYFKLRSSLCVSASVYFNSYTWLHICDLQNTPKFYTILLSGLNCQRALTKRFHLPKVLGGREGSHLWLCFIGQTTDVFTIEFGLNCLFTPWLNCKQLTTSITRTFFSWDTFLKSYTIPSALSFYAFWSLSLPYWCATQSTGLEPFSIAWP